MKSGKMALGEKSLYRSSLRGNKCFSLIAGILFEAGKETNAHFWKMRADTNFIGGWLIKLVLEIVSLPRWMNHREEKSLVFDFDKN